MTKKLTAFLLAMIMVFGLVGCAGGTGSETTAAETTEVISVETEAPEVKIELTISNLRLAELCSANLQRDFAAR